MDKDKRIIYIASLLALILGVNYFGGAKSTYKFLLLVFASVFLYQFSKYTISFGRPSIMEKTTKEDGLLKDFGLNPNDYKNPSKVIKESKQISGGANEKKNDDKKVNETSKINPFSMNGLC